MKRLISSVLVLVILLGSLPSIFALSTSNPALDNTKIPEHAVQIAEGIFSLGTARVDGKVVQGFLFVRYKEGFAKPPGTPGKGNDKDTSDFLYYELMGKGVYWKTKENYIYDQMVPDYITTIETSFSTWEGVGYDIFGTSIAGTVDGIDTVSPDDKNEILFGNIGEPGAIAMCVTWGIFGGPPPFRQLVEFDIIFDEVDFDWSISGEAGKMDLENIATHEIGHALGLADLYDWTYDTTDLEVLNTVREQTMYGFATEGETKKRTLEAGDIAGVEALYG